MDVTPEARDLVAGLPADRRPLFDHVLGLAEQEHPDLRVVVSYKMPTLVVGERRLHVGVWAHGISFYGWRDGRDAGLPAENPHALSGKGTFRLTPADAERIGDDRLREFLRAVLAT